jgi:hypothetical protein
MYNKWKQSNLVNRCLQSTLKSVKKKTKHSVVYQQYQTFSLMCGSSESFSQNLSRKPSQLTKSTDSRSRSTLLENSTNGWHARKGRGALFTPDFSLPVQLPEDHASTTARLPRQRGRWRSPPTPCRPGIWRKLALATAMFWRRRKLAVPRFEMLAAEQPWGGDPERGSPSLLRRFPLLAEPRRRHCRTDFLV